MKSLSRCLAAVLAVALLSGSYLLGANGLTLNASLAYSGNNATVQTSVVNLVALVSGNGLNSLASVTVPTSAGAIPLGSVTAAGGWLFVRNNDATNYMQVITATSGTPFARLLPGEFCLLRLDSGLTAPFWKANVATVQATLAVFDN